MNCEPATVLPHPPPYLDAMHDYLVAHESELLEWFASHEAKREHAEAVHLDLLKTTYRLDRADQGELYAQADEAAAALSLACPVTFYQSQDAGGATNASLAYVDAEVHVVLQGTILSTLTASEKKALIGHELTHFLLWHGRDGRYLTTSKVLNAMALDEQAEPAHLESARLFDLYSEIFCDRGALHVAGDLSATVAMLVKVETGLSDVSSERYLAQADEIFAQSEVSTEGISHPECFIRCRALRLHHESREDASAGIERMIEGRRALVPLDLLGQRRVAELTRRLIEILLAPKWMQSESMLAHARSYFSDWSPAPGADAAELQVIADFDDSLKTYFCYVLLDFVAADRDLEEGPLAAAILLARSINLDTELGERAAKELNLRKSQIEQIQKNAEQLVAAAGTEPAA